MVGILITFPQMSLVYKSGVPEFDINKVKIEIPEDAPEKSIDLQKELGGAGKAVEPGKDAAATKSPEDKAADDIEKALRGGK